MMHDVANRTWWAAEILIPAIFTILGASLGFLASQLKDSVQARRAKKQFLRAIAVELGAIRHELQGARDAVDVSVARLQTLGVGPEYVPRWSSAVFTSQLSKLHDVADPLLLEVISVYVSISMIERVVEVLNQHSLNFNSARAGNEKADAQTRVRSALLVLKEEIERLMPRIDSLRGKLDPGTQTGT